jgi:hypothetical protein
VLDELVVERVLELLGDDAVDHVVSIGIRAGRLDI